MDSEEEEDDGSMELNPVSEKESDNEQDCSSIAKDDAELHTGDNSMNSNELDGTSSAPYSLLVVTTQRFTQNQIFKVQLAVEILGEWCK